MSASASWTPSATCTAFTATACAVADFYLENTPTDGIPYWDTGAPGLAHMPGALDKPADPYNEYEPVDSSAAAIAAQGLLHHQSYGGISLTPEGRDIAVRMLRRHARVPLVAHFPVIAAMSRLPHFGVHTRVLTRLQRLAGFDVVIMPGFGSGIMTSEAEGLEDVAACIEQVVLIARKLIFLHRVAQ